MVNAILSQSWDPPNLANCIEILASYLRNYQHRLTRSTLLKTHWSFHSQTFSRNFSRP